MFYLSRVSRSRGSRERCWQLALHRTDVLLQTVCSQAMLGEVVGHVSIWSAAYLRTLSGNPAVAMFYARRNDKPESIASLLKKKRRHHIQIILSNILKEQKESDNENNKGDSTYNEGEESASESMKIIQTKSQIPCHLCGSSNVHVTGVVKCPKCFWHDNKKIYP